MFSKCIFKKYRTTISFITFNSATNVNAETASITNLLSATACFFWKHMFTSACFFPFFAYNVSIITASITKLSCATACFQNVSIGNKCIPNASINSISSTHVIIFTAFITNLPSQVKISYTGLCFKNCCQTRLSVTRALAWNWVANPKNYICFSKVTKCTPFAWLARNIPRIKENMEGKCWSHHGSWVRDGIL